MQVVVIGNGILGLMTAYRLLRSDASVNVTIIGPQAREGCASLAAAAMFNSYCEVDTSTLSNKFEREKFSLNRSANEKWPNLIKELQEESKVQQEHGFGTYLINNHISDRLEDENFDAVISALKEFKEPFESASPAQIPLYKPTASGRASRAIFIPREGWINPRTLFEALDRILSQSKRVKFVDQPCKSLRKANGKIESVQLENGESLGGDVFALTPGAVFSKIINASNLGLIFPKIFYGVGSSILLKTGENTLKNCIRTPNRGLACGVYAAPHGTEFTLIGASSLILNEPEFSPRLTSVQSLLTAAMDQINSDYYRSLLVKVNVGWRPVSEDTVPLIGGTSLKNLWIATGTRRDGLHCSPVISEYLCDMILRGSSKRDFKLYQPERKPIRIYTREEAIRTGVRHTINALYQHGFKPSHNRILEDLESHYRKDLNDLHDKVGAVDWGIPTDMVNMYRYNHIR